MPIRGPGRSSHTVPSHPAHTQKHTAATRHQMASHALAHDTSAVHTMATTAKTRAASPAKKKGTSSRGSDASSGLTTDSGMDSTSPLTVAPAAPGGGSGGSTGSAGSGNTTPADDGTPELDDTNLVKWLVAWGIIFALLYVLNRSRWGHALIYYGLALALLLLFAINYKAITALLGPATGTQGTDAPTSSGAQEVPGGDLPGAGVNQRQDVQNGQLTSTTPLRQAAPPVPFSSWVG